jgi:hypothetical protein
MSALDTALPLALSAALYPPALLTLVLLLSAKHPRRLVLAYLAGAALMVIGVGLIGLAVIDATASSSSDQASTGTTGGVDIVIGTLLLALAWYASKRRGARRQPKPAPKTGAVEKPGRIAALSARATTSQKWAFALGLVMFLPSPMYLLAISDIAATNDPPGSKVAAMLICAVTVLLFVEVPAAGMYLRPDSVTSSITRFNDWLKRNGWTLAAALALIAGVYAIVKGIGKLS